MTRYINVDELKDWSEIVPLTEDGGIDINDFEEKLKSMPTIDVMPVRHAKWIPKITKIGGIDWPSGMKCSGCGEDALNAEGIDFLTDFCPHCGARMDEDNVE